VTCLSATLPLPSRLIEYLSLGNNVRRFSSSDPWTPPKVFVDCQKIADVKQAILRTVTIVKDWTSSKETSIHIIAMHAFVARYLKKYLDREMIECAILTGRDNSNDKIPSDDDNATGTSLDEAPMSEDEKMRIGKSWNDGELRVLISTYIDGLDNTSVGHVISLGCSYMADDLVQSVGRIRPSQQKNGARWTIIHYSLDQFDNDDPEMMRTWYDKNCLCSSTSESERAIFDSRLSSRSAQNIVEGERCIMEAITNAMGGHGQKCYNCNTCCESNYAEQNSSTVRTALRDREEMMRKVDGFIYNLVYDGEFSQMQNGLCFECGQPWHYASSCMSSNPARMFGDLQCVCRYCFYFLDKPNFVHGKESDGGCTLGKKLRNFIMTYNNPMLKCDKNDDDCGRAFQYQIAAMFASKEQFYLTMNKLINVHEQRNG
jgi:hypothetical protein